MEHYPNQKFIRTDRPNEEDFNGLMAGQLLNQASLIENAVIRYPILNVPGGERYQIVSSETPTEAVYSVVHTPSLPTKRLETAESITRKLDEVALDDEMYEGEEPRPTQDVIRKVKELIRDTKYYLSGRRFPIAVVRTFDGSIRITWIAESGSVRLVYSENANENYIFHEEVQEGRSSNYGIDSNVNPRSLASWLAWLNSR